MKILLKQLALIKVSGPDSETFLQNQFSNDLTKLKDKTIQLSAYCQHQGKVIALFWVMRKNGSYLLSFPRDLAEKVMARLSLFIIMSDVKIEDVSEKYHQVGLINESHSNAYSYNHDLSLHLDESKEVNEDIDDNNDEWIKACIDFQIPEVSLINSEKLVPQMLNLDINEVGVNFSKGCYPGQEVVARLHYLGEAKRRLFAFKSEHEIKVGDSLYCASSKTAKARGNRYKGSGIVVNSVKLNSLFYCLATLDIDLLDSEITLNNKHGPQLNLIKK
ncbi:MAG: YgfZ/GcvT domain-containing protein [Candidatus Pseudothioglobus sp.]